MGIVNNQSMPINLPAGAFRTDSYKTLGQLIRRFMIVLGNSCDGGKIGLLGVIGKIVGSLKGGILSKAHSCQLIGFNRQG